MTESTLALNGPVMIAAGGTGGHLFPGQALAQELKRRGHSIVLITDERVQRFDRLFPGADIFSVPAATFSGRGLWGLLTAAGKIVSGTSQSFGILGRVRPSVVIGFGGYPTLPPMMAAILRRVPTIVHEQNAVLGRVNKTVAPFVRIIASTFPSPKYLKARDADKLVVTGNPVRDAVLARANVPYEPLGNGPIRLLVFGGSQGARVMSDVVPDALSQLPSAFRQRLQVVQQCRPEDIERVRGTYASAGIDATLSDFFDNMPEEIANAHLVIGRAGASTVSELAVIGRPSILVPLPHSLDQDQKANAEVLADADAAWMIEQAGFTPEALAGRLVSLFEKPSALEDAAAAAKKQGKPDAVQALADLVERTASGQSARLQSLAEQDGLLSSEEGTAVGKETT
ncbi:MAG: undecaprenyldiphospho-muramoylpentapeptide beta-N-acetylglucosaminyltransferase [Parvibaculaceae bacterium]